MSKDKISDYSTTANSNTDIGGINVDEGCAPSGINDAIRTLMSQLKTWQSGGQDVYIHPAGSASAPSITANGDTNTGIFFPAADTVGITTGGTERARVDSSGNLGIGTSSPSSALYVKRTSGNAGIYADYNGTNIGRLEAASNGNLYIGLTTGSGDISIGNTSNASAVVLNSSGNLGLGVTPSAWGSGKAIEVGYNGNAVWSYSQTDSYLTHNAKFTDAWRYVSSAAASTYRQSGGVHYWNIAASGTAGNAITFTQAMTLDASGNFVVGDTTANRAGATRGISVNGTSSSVVEANYSSGRAAYMYAYADGTIIGEYRNKPVLFTTNDTERARIDSSGNLLVGTTSQFSSVARIAISLTPGGVQNGIEMRPTNNNTYYPMLFENNAGSTVGYIQATTSATSYVTSSDYRLKENIAPMTGALEKVALLKPCTYTWKADGSASQGFIAHELQEVVPECVAGEKDAVDEDGNPKYQGIDTSFLVATLTAAIQELKAEFDAYKASHP